ncbi:Poly [ADP-ribose] polymerase 2 [Asimina triloba]
MLNLFTSQVALGDMEELLSANYNADKLPKGKLSTKGVGATAPDPSDFQMLEDGTIVPCGQPKEQEGPKGPYQFHAISCDLADDGIILSIRNDSCNNDESHEAVES